MGRTELPNPKPEEELSPNHFYAAYVLDGAEARLADATGIAAEAGRLGYPVRYWWLSQAVDIGRAPDRLIICVHHPSGDEMAGTDLYDALKQQGVAWDDLDAAAVREYAAWGQPMTDAHDIRRPDGRLLYPEPSLDELAQEFSLPPIPEPPVKPDTYLVRYVLSGLMLVEAENAQAASAAVAATLNGLLGKSEQAGPPPTVSRNVLFSELAVDVDMVEATEFPTDDQV